MCQGRPNVNRSDTGLSVSKALARWPPPHSSPTSFRAGPLGPHRERLNPASRNPSDVEAVRASAEGYSLGFATLASGVQSSVTENGVLTLTIGSVSVSLTGSSRLGTRSKCCVAQQDPAPCFSGFTLLCCDGLFSLSPPITSLLC